LFRNSLILFLICLSTFSCVDKQESPTKDNRSFLIECDAETKNENSFLDKSGKIELSNASGQTREFSRSGQYALKLSKNAPYGMGITLRKLKPGDLLEVSVWALGTGLICVSADNPEDFYLTAEKEANSSNDKWSLISLNLEVPSGLKSDSLKFYLSNTMARPCYFDDLRIEKLKKKTAQKVQTEDAINIFISDENLNKLKKKRDAAIEAGLLSRTNDDWVKGILFYQNQVLKSKIRLKGDRLDHLEGNKWSYRIKIQGDKAWKGMKKFSLQTPAARNFLHEWFFHKALEKEDMLHTRYGFVPVLLNGKPVGIYAYEEHFTKQLVEAQKRREGPVLKLSDDSYWVVDKLKRQKSIDFSVPNYDAAVIVPFDEKKVLENALLNKEFEFAKELYQRYKYAQGPASDIFNIEALAKYYAMIDATNAYHTLQFFNQRFYYNPALGKLEPVFFDSFSDVGVFDFFGSDLIIEEYEKKWISQHLKPFGDPKFKKLYFDYLEKYSSRDFWEEIYADNQAQIENYAALLKNEFKSYAFNVEDFIQIAEIAGKAGRTLRDLDDEENVLSRFASRSVKPYLDYTGKADLEVLPYLIKVYRNSEDRLYFENLTTDTILIRGFSDVSKIPNESLSEPFVLPPANSKANYSIEILSQNEGNQFASIEIRGQILQIPIIPWKAPGNGNIPIELVKNDYLNELISDKSILKRLDTLIITRDLHITKHLIIPANHIVKIEPGSRINLIEGATFISYSPVLSFGTDLAPVIIESTDQSGKGFNIFQAKMRSQLNYTQFIDLNFLDFDGWQSTGAVCFYESDVDMDHVQFIKNRGGDDGLNIVRSNFKLTNCLFKNSLADGFDSDFSTGTIRNTQFESPGNDAIDFSGSQVELSQILVTNAGDKIISCGEESTIRLEDCRFDGARIGIASKDKSKVTIENCQLSNLNYGLVAFCKKPEYGSADIKAKKINTNNVVFLHLIERGSSLQFNNREIIGQERNLANRFY